jgi:hypothetical protein
LFLSTNDADSTRPKKCLVHAEHEILIFLYFKLTSCFGHSAQLLHAKTLRQIVMKATPYGLALDSPAPFHSPRICLLRAFSTSS